MESTRRIVMFNWMTANGYFAGADGNLDWVVPDEEQAKAAVDGIPLFDTRAVRPPDLRALRGILAARRRRHLHRAGPAPSRRTNAENTAS